MAALFPNDITRGPGTYRPHDVFAWLEDGSDASVPPAIAQGRQNANTPVALGSSPRSSASPALAFTNLHGKRPLHTHNDSHDHRQQERKRMRVENKERSEVASGRQQASFARPSPIELSGSPPSPERTKRTGQHDRNYSAVRSIESTGHGSTGTTAPFAGPRPTAGPTPSTDPRMCRPADRETRGTPSIRPQSSAQPWQQAPRHSKVKTEPYSQVRATSTATVPFVIDDSSDDEASVKFDSKPALQQQIPPAQASSRRDDGSHRRVASRARMSATQRELQMAESRKRRQEAEEKKCTSPWSFSGLDDSDAPIKPDVDLAFKPAVVDDHAFPPMAGNRILDHRPQNRPPKRVVDFSGDFDMEDSFKPSQASYQQPWAASLATHSNHQVVNLEKQRAEAQRKKDTELRARLKESDERRRKEGEARQDAEAKRRAKAAEEQLARDKLQEQYDLEGKNRAEAALRSRALVEANRKLAAQEEADAKKEAQARKDEQAKRRQEQKDWEERKRQEDRQREVLRKQQAEASKEKSTLSEREAALAKLSAVKPPPKTCESRAAANINDVVAKHSPRQGLHFKDDSGSSAAGTARKTVREIQERNRQSGLFEIKEELSGDSGRDDRREKEKRILAMKDRNARLREAEEKQGKKEEEESGLLLENDDHSSKHRGSDDERHGSRALSPGSPPLPKGPQSLSSAAGQALLAHHRSVSHISHSKTHRHGRQLGEILPEDAQLVRWRDTGMRFRDISTLWPRNYGTSRADKTLQLRYKQVKEALKSHDLDGESPLVMRVIRGEADARVELNRRVHGEWPLPGQKSAGDAKGHVLLAAVDERELPQRAKTPAPAQNLTTSFDSSTTDGTLDHEYRPAERPRVGGKTIKDEAYFHLLELHAEEMGQADDDVAPAFDREDSPVTEADRRQFVYWVERREIAQEELDDGYVLEDKEWHKLDDDFCTLGQANEKTGYEAFCLPPSMADKVDISEPYTTRCETSKYGCKKVKTWWEGAGEVELRVVRRDNYSKDAVLPRSKEQWVGRELYQIFERRVVWQGSGATGDGGGVDAPENEGVDAAKDAGIDTTENGEVNAPEEEEGDDLAKLFGDEPEKPKKPEKPKELEGSGKPEEPEKDETHKKQETDTTDVVGGHVYSSLEEANKAAIEYFVEQTFYSESGHLTKRGMEKQAVRNKLAAELKEAEIYEDDEVFFEKEVECEGKEEGGSWVKLVVWVRKMELKGPRNL